jgi:hypothetical protein
LLRNEGDDRPPGPKNAESSQRLRLAQVIHFDNDELTFDYRLKPGVVRHTNGLALMRAVGIDV